MRFGGSVPIQGYHTDAHAKNHALLYLGGGRVSLAPRYDMLPARLGPNLSDALSYNIGAAERFTDITADDFDAFQAVLGIVSPAAQRRTRTRLAAEIARGLAPTLPSLDDGGHKGFADLIAANMRVLLPQFGVPVPPQAQQRDAHIQRGGGWLQS
jgi:serine/threonine-protein kinase HipA